MLTFCAPPARRLRVRVRRKATVTPNPRLAGPRESAQPCAGETKLLINAAHEDAARREVVEDDEIFNFVPRGILIRRLRETAALKLDSLTPSPQDTTALPS